MLRIVWEFRARQDRLEEFEAQYGEDGAWALLFRTGAGYRRTTLLRDRDTPGRYLTIDEWDDTASWRAFKETHAQEYAVIDRLCGELTEDERCLGYFEIP